MKKAYTIFLYAIAVFALAWFLPWLYSLALPSVDNDPFVGYSPVADAFVISENGDKARIFVDGDDRNYTKEERDSLLPHIYFTQLTARNQMPDSIDGKAMTIPNLKHSQWVMTSLPMDINKVQPSWHLIMESMPKRMDLEDPTEAFSLEGGKATFIDMATNTVNKKRSDRFTKALAEKGFKYPAKKYSANITARKVYDEGYLITDSEGSVFHMKMRAGTPYVAKVNMPDGVKAEHVFVMENNDRRLLGLVFDMNSDVYAIERDGYRIIKLPMRDIDPTRDRISAVANMFNIVLRARNDSGARWIAIDTDTYDLLGEYTTTYSSSKAALAANWIFPFSLSFSSVDDSYAYPRIDDISLKALPLNIILAIIVYCMMIKDKRRKGDAVISAACTLIFGIYFFIVSLLIR